MDSSHPTRSARHGLLFTKKGGIKILNSKHKTMFCPPDPTCSCFTCKNYTLAYLNHLLKAKEMTAYTLATIHNLTFMVKQMAEYRQQIIDGKL